MGSSLKNTTFEVESRLQEAARGDHGACYDLGICYQTGTAGVGVDLVEAHKWFNLAAVHGIVAAQQARTEVACDMTARQIAAAQRAARDWIAISVRRAA